MLFMIRTPEPGRSRLVHEIHIQQRFSCAPAQVFDVFHRHERLAEVYPAQFVRVIDAAGDDPDGVGSVREISGPGLRFREQVTHCEVPSLIEYRIIEGMPLITAHHGVMRFVDDSGGTLLDYRIALRFRPPLNWLGVRLMERMVRARIRRLALRLARPQ